MATTGIIRPATKKEQREASVEKLLAAALARFVSRGYRHTTVEQIADEAGLTKGSVYFYFRNKAALLHRLLDRVEAIVVDPIPKRLNDAGPDARDRMVSFVHGQAVLGAEKWEYVLLLILMSLEFAGSGDEIESRITAIYRRLYGHVEGIIAAGRRSGAFRADLSTRDQAAIVMAGHDGTFLEWYRRRDGIEGPALVRALRTVTLGGLAGPHTMSKGE